MAACGLVAAASVVSLAWLGLGAAWLFDPGCERVADERGSITELYGTAMVAWGVLLLLVSIPCFVMLVVLPVMLLFRCSLAFALIGCLAGAQGGTMQL